jgi:PKD repeat protein
MAKNRWNWIGTLLCCVIVLALATPQLYGADGDTPAGGPLAIATPPAKGGPALVRVYYGADRALYSGVLKSFDVLETDYEQGYHVVQATPLDLQRLQQVAGLRVETESLHTVDQYFQPRAAAEAEIESIPSYPCYRTVEETFATAQAIADNHPALATWTDQGDSWEKTQGQGGYDLMVLVLTNSAIPGPKPKLFVTSAIHAREYATAELVTRFAESLINGYGTDADATWLIDHHELHFMLHANPDGRKQAETGLSWRKNTNDNYCSFWPNYRGADLNRNFEFSWGCCGGSSGSECDATYRGPSAASEPETQAVQNYVRANFADNRGPDPSDPAPDDTPGVYLDIHSHGKLLLWPWGHTSDPAPNGTQLQTLGRKLAYWNDHSPEQAIGLYPTDGTTDGVGYGELGVASFTYELGTAFFESCSYFEDTIVPDNMPSLLYAAKVVRTPYLTPAGPEALSLSLSDGASAPGVPAGTPVTLQATVDDTRYNNSNGTEPAQNVTSAEVYVDDPPWVTGATAIAMSASDGAFDSTIEGVEATIDTTGLSDGQHILFVRGQDANGSWGAFSAVFLYVSAPSPAPAVSIMAPAEGATVAGPAVLVQIDATDDADPAGALTVEWNVDGGAWLPATWNGVSGYYEASWDSTAVSDGPHTLNAQATDSEANVGSDSVNVTVDNVNEAPVASFTFSCTGLSCDFDGSASYDPDGTITGYDWDFGDGSPNGSGATPSHTYPTADTYTVILTVTDDDDATDDDTQNVSVSEPLTVHVGDLDGSSAEAPRGRWDATVTITVHDNAETPISGALVEGAWSDGATGGDSCTTDGSGQCSVTKGNLKSNVPSVTFGVSNVASGAGAYAPGDNHDPDADSDGTVIVVGQPVDNTPPTVNITAPSDGATFSSGAMIDFSGTASDVEDGDLTGSLIWTSDLDGQIGTGGSFSAVLSDGVHTVTAEVTDSGGASGSDTVGITVGSPPAVHVGDLDGVGTPVRSKWEATVTITVHDQNEIPLANAVVAGTWSAGATGGAECTTDGGGQCSVVKGNLKSDVTSVTFTVDGVTLSGYGYAPAANHDPDGDSDGTSITVSSP